MNKEIKFKGISISSNKWIFGDLIQYTNGDTSILEHRYYERIVVFSESV
jgi:hypothetical protein